MPGVKFTKRNGIRVGKNAFVPCGETNFVAFGLPFRIGRVTYIVSECVCGNATVPTEDSVRRGRSTSCGCENKKRASARRKTHGKKGTPEHNSWASMKARCNNTESRSYPRYGQRGITVCDRWNASFEAFLSDMGQKPSSECTIDRIDNSKGYEPSNCRWATKAVQSNNRRCNVRISLYGMSKTAAEWSRISLVPAPVIIGRIRRGIDAKQAVFSMTGSMSKRIAMEMSVNG